MPPQAWPKNRLAAEAIDAAWAALARAGAPDIGLQPLPEPPYPVLPPQLIAAPALAARQPPAQLPAAWWVGSYSSLAHGARHDNAAADHDLRVLPAAGAEPGAALADDDILRFPRGAAAGECLHAVFEQIDFTAPSGWPAAVAAALQRFAPDLPDAAAAADQAAPRQRMLLRMLNDVLHTPLAGGVRLAEVPPQRRRVEMEFHLPSRRLDAKALDAWLKGHGLGGPTLAFGTLSGYLRGFIDLVFEHGGRYHVLDWKSNFLGTTAADYAPPALARAMAEQGYHLQALLYALALHRHLQQRLPDYRHDRHFGGVMYLFVRGVRPGWADAEGTASGVFVHQPGWSMLEQLSALLDGGGGA
jgi:exodeoxyribonuclease V beta subunit